MTQEPDLLKMLAVAENAGEAWADGEHIDIFTPTRVRLLIERVVRAEQNFDEADSAKINAEGREENALSRAEKAERSCRLLGTIIERDGKNLVELTNSQDIIPEDGDGDWEVVWERAQEMKDRLEQAEQAVARAREVAAGWATNDRPFREALLRALDGDTRG
ncbi:hypothetical protein [Glutamicibacter sp. MCAF14]|uniref:hypothetical protein n=1 Tax=Glutamicibacter sp. MCAF14 TaxID=3233043 RepID=UPI003F93DB6E